MLVDVIFFWISRQPSLFNNQKSLKHDTHTSKSFKDIYIFVDDHENES